MRVFSRVLITAALATGLLFAGSTTPASAMTAKHGEWVAKVAYAQKGDPYQWGANGPSRFDCAGLVQYVYKQTGKSLPRTAGQQRYVGQRIPKAYKRKGDILVFINSSGTAYHSAIYAGNGYVWEAQRTGTVVGMHKIWSSGYIVRRPY